MLCANNYFKLLWFLCSCRHQTSFIFSELCWSWKSTWKHFVRLVVLIFNFLMYYYVQLFLQRDSQRYSVKLTVFFYCFLQKGVLLWSPLSEGWQRTFWRLRLPSYWRVIYTILCICNISHLVMRNVWRWCLVFCTPPFFGISKGMPWRKSVFVVFLLYLSPSFHIYYIARTIHSFTFTWIQAWVTFLP